MTTEKPRFMLATLAVLAAVGLQSLAAAQEKKVVTGNVVKSKPVPYEPRFDRPAASIGIHGFSIVLVVGSTQTAAAGASDTVPEAARKALVDMKDFLPYKRYQLLDAAWILCCSPNTNQVSGRVRGPDGRDYHYTVDPGDIVGSKLNLRFVMREYQDSLAASVNIEKLSDTARLELVRQQAEAARELEEAELQYRTIRQRVEVGTATSSDLESATMRAQRARSRAQDLERMATKGQVRVTAQGGGGRGGAGRTSAATARGATTTRELMDSSFSISAGETVVIGTSRINGDQALISILTAAPSRGPPARDRFAPADAARPPRGGDRVLIWAIRDPCNPWQCRMNPWLEYEVVAKIPKPPKSAAETRAIMKKLERQHPGADTELHYTTPYELLVATILSAQCTDERVNQVTPALFRRYPDAKALAKATTAELEPQIQSTGFFRAKSKSLLGMATAVSEKHAGAVPATMAALVDLPGVGRKTANVVLGHALGVPGLPVDRHVLRVSNRIGIAKGDDPEVVERQLCAAMPKEKWTVTSDTLILHGRRICKPKPLCDQCAVRDECLYFLKVMSKQKVKGKKS
jgi:endonuclease-3